MAKFRSYEPAQAWLLPPSVKDVLGEEHLSFFVHEVVERLELAEMYASYGEEGQPGYDPRCLLKVWLYAYCLGVTSARRLEQRIREDLGFRYLAGGQQPDHWTLSAFRRRHPSAVNTVFTQVLEWARAQGWARLGHVAIDSTRIAANASRDHVFSVQGLRQERARLRQKVRQWQKQCEQASQQEAAGTAVERGWQQRLQEIPKQLKQLRKAGLQKQSPADPDSRFLRQRQGFVLGYTADIAVSEDHLIVAQRVSQQSHDNASLIPLIEQVEQRCQQQPQQLLADTGYFQTEQVQTAQARGIDVYIPDSNLARELRHGRPAEQTDGCIKKRSPLVEQMRTKLRSVAGRATYRKRCATVELVFGVLKEQRQGRRFRLRSLAKVGLEFCFMALAFNVSRLYQLKSLAT